MHVGPSSSLQQADPVLARRIVTLLMVLSLLGNMTLQVILPAMPRIQSDFHSPPGAVQLLVSLSFLVFGFAMLIYGPAADRYGRRPIYLVGMGLYTLGNLLCTMAPSLALLVAGRTLSSAGSAVSMVLPRAIVRDTHEGHNTAKVLSRIAIISALAPMIAPPIGGLLSDAFGWRALFALLGVIGIISCALIYFLMPETLRETGRPVKLWSTVSSFGTLLRDRRFTGYALNGAFIPGAFFVYMTAAPFIYVGVLGLSATGYAMYYMTTVIGSLAGYLLAGRLAGRASIDRALSLATWGCFAAAAVGALLPFIMPVTPWSLTLPVVALMIAAAVNAPNNQAAIVGGDPRTIGAASGLAGFLQMIVGATLIEIVGVLPQNTPYPMTLSMLLSAACALAAILWGRGKRNYGVP